MAALLSAFHPDLPPSFSLSPLLSLSFISIPVKASLLFRVDLVSYPWFLISRLERARFFRFEDIGCVFMRELILSSFSFKEKDKVGHAFLPDFVVYHRSPRLSSLLWWGRLIGMEITDKYYANERSTFFSFISVREKFIIFFDLDLAISFILCEILCNDIYCFILFAIIFFLYSM